MVMLNSVTANSRNIAATASGFDYPFRRTAVVLLDLGCHSGAMLGR